MPIKYVYVTGGAFNCFNLIPNTKHEINLANNPNFNVVLDAEADLIIGAHGNAQGVLLNGARVSVTNLATHIIEQFPVAQRRRIWRVTYMICHAAQNARPINGLAQLSPLSTIELIGDSVRIRANQNAWHPLISPRVILGSVAAEPAGWRLI